MYRQAIAAFTATSAVLLAAAAPANAEDATVAAQCSNRDDISINVTPPASLTGTITADEIRGLMESVVADTSLHGFFSPPLPMYDDLDSARYPGRALSPSLPIPNLPPLASLMPPGRGPYGPPRVPVPTSAYEPWDTPTPAHDMLETLVNRAIECVRRSAAPGTELPPLLSVDTSPVTRYLEALVATRPLVCDPETGRPSPAQNPTTLLESLGVQSLLEAVVDNSTLCANLATSRPASAVATGTTSVLNRIGVAGLLDALLDD
ncbi:hypothetical protein GCM10022224_042310 [Nonomuraea antimicrobica]|uniref:Uncharacterized protein n=1 Tax=Nonomuraea antimicrobica TaxID=561173 RepID=A0ABP7C0T3_9ACTN